MNNSDYQNYVKNARSRDKLAEITAQYLAVILKQNNFAIVKHYCKPQPFEIISNYSFITDLLLWQKDFYGFKPTKGTLEITSYNKNYYCFLNTDFVNRDSYFWCAAKMPDTEVRDVLHHWYFLDHQLLNCLTNHEKELSVSNANIISQLLHDIEAIIELAPRQDTSIEFEQRLKYQRKLNVNLLFYIRPLDLIKEQVPINELIESSLEIININPDTVSLTLSEQLTDIFIDVEMFAKGFNEIILNALEARESEADKITIRIKEEEQLSPLLDYNWLKIEISNTGKAIIEDFLPYVSEPFFTTQKHEGHTGFGLNIAEKIFKEHGGSLDISAAEEIGTTVTIFLPLEHEKAKNINN